MIPMLAALGIEAGELLVAVAVVAISDGKNLGLQLADS
jgi:hypothetical protein